MCDPVTIGSLALTAVGTGLQSAAQSRVQSARDDALAAERIRQKGYDEQAAALSAGSQDRYQDFGTKQEAKATTLADYFTGQQASTPNNETIMPQSDSNITVANETARKGEAKQRTDQIGTALGGLRAFGDLLGDNSRLQARDSSQIGQIGGFKKGSSNVLAYELEDANKAGSSLGVFGQIASGLGRVGTAAGLSGTGANWFGSTPAVTNSMSGMAAARAADRMSVPGYAAASSSPGLFSMFGGA